MLSRDRSVLIILLWEDIGGSREHRAGSAQLLRYTHIYVTISLLPPALTLTLSPARIGSRSIKQEPLGSARQGNSDVL